MVKQHCNDSFNITKADFQYVNLASSLTQLPKHKSQSPPAKRSRRLKEMKRVTFDPVVQESLLKTTNGNVAEIKPPPVTLKEAADIVVRYLDPFYKRGKFANKVIFLF